MIEHRVNNSLNLDHFECSESFECKIINDAKHRIIRAVLKLLIITKMSERTAMSTPNMIHAIKNEFNIQFSPGTVYPIFRKLQKEGYIEELPIGRKRMYKLTPKGTESSRIIQKSTKKLKSILNDVIKY